MSFNGYKLCIDEGDTVILFFGFDCMLQFEVDKQKTHQTRYGALKHSDLIGIPYGSKVNCSRGWVYVLHPTPELWTVTLPHRTQILYSTDISLITLQLELKPGSVVVESGTGSASLSHAIVRTVAPSGHLYTFDFHEQRVMKAKDEFKRHGISDLVTVQQRDVCATGFGMEDIADALFLDLPCPWDALPFAKKTLKKNGGRLCSFSPCIEQVQKTCIKMAEEGFSDIETMECLTRSLDVRKLTIPVADLGSNNSTDTVHVPFVGTYVKNDEQSDDVEEEDKPKKKYKSHAKYSEPKEKVNKGLSYVFKSGVPPMTMPGHTGYLTFATLY